MTIAESGGFFLPAFYGHPVFCQKTHKRTRFEPYASNRVLILFAPLYPEKQMAQLFIGAPAFQSCTMEKLAK
ncbi:MAG: hypothetical protein ABS987_01090 [Ruminococcus sp.]